MRYFGHGLKGLASTARSKSNIAAALLKLDPLPDLVALQEVETRSIRAQVAHRGAHDQETQLEAFLRHLGHAFSAAGRVMPYRAFYFPAHVYRLGPIKLYTTGLAVLVDAQRLQVVNTNQEQPHPITHVTHERLRKVKQTRIAAHLALETVHGERFHLFNTHLSLPSAWAKEFWSEPQKMGFGKNQLAEARTLAEYAAHISAGEPYLICGDFNAAPASPVYRSLTHDAKLLGAQEALGQVSLSDPRAFSTAGFMHLRMHLDHVFGSRDVAFVDLHDTHDFDDEGPFSGLSDHVPLVTRFGFE
ncbi:MAG: endonuclease/exonuclease/phosphatase family protein [Myxococcaceae bacterium]